MVSKRVHSAIFNIVCSLNEVGPCCAFERPCRIELTLSSTNCVVGSGNRLDVRWSRCGVDLVEVVYSVVDIFIFDSIMGSLA